MDRTDEVLATAITGAMMAELELVMNGHVLAAQTVLPPPEIAFMLFKTAANVARGAMLYALQTKNDALAPEQICEFVEQSIAQLIANTRPQVLAKFEELTTARAEVA